MAKIYEHKVHGQQVTYTVYFPDGSRKTKYRSTSSKAMADQFLRCARFIESGSRAGNLTTREIAQARHDNLLSENEARLLSGGKAVEPYNLERVLQNFETSSKLKNSPYNHKCQMWILPIIEGMPRGGRFVFGGNKPVSEECIYSGVKKILARAGLPKDLSLHHLRHTFGSWLLRTTGDLKFVQEALWHLDINTTKMYVHTIAEEDDPVRTFGYD